MKKYLAMLCALMTLTVLPSCSDNQESSSEPSSSVSESTTGEVTTEPETTIEVTTTEKTTIVKTTKATTETTTTKATEPTTTISDYKIYENDYYTMKISSEWDSWSDGDYKWFDISPNLKLELWGVPTGLRYNNNKDFAEYWVNDANNDSRITYPFEISVFGENYFAHSIEDNCFSYVCQNGEDINFFDFHFDDILDENEEKIVSDILTSIKLKHMNESYKNETTTTKPPAIKTANSFEPFTISGTGSTVIKDVNIPAEFVVYSATHNGTSNFIARFYDCNDGRESLVNEIGNYSCTQVLDATDIDDSSSGMVEVDADGDWSITFSPVKSVVSNETSTSFSGYGADITGAFKSTGNMVCTVSHDGSSNFIVHAYELTEDGDRESVANEIGEYNGQCVIRTKKDTLYFFEVDADGNWTIDVE